MPRVLFRLFDMFVKSGVNDIYTDWHISTKMLINTNVDASRKKLLNNNRDIIESEVVLCQKWCINGKIMWQGMFVMFIAD